MVEGKRGRDIPKKKVGGCNRESYEVGGCKWVGCRKSSSVKIE